MHNPQRRPLPVVTIVAVLLLLCIFPGQYWVTSRFPEISGLIRIDPSVVILDIPNPLPVPIDLILVPALFFLIYPVIILLYPSRTGTPSWREALLRARSVFAGLLVLLLCTLSGGLLYYLAQDYLPRNVRNGINSFGINADIYLPYPGYETIRLRGSMVLGVCVVIGLSIFIRKIRREPGIKKTAPLTREQRMTPYERMMREKRMQEKQMREERAQIEQARKEQLRRVGSAGKIQTATRNPPPARTGDGMEQVTSRPVQYGLSRLCRNQPVMIFEPEAVNYRPKIPESL